MRQLYRRHQGKINYLFVGVWNTAIGYGSFVALYYIFSAHIHYIVLFLISNIISITNAYIGYKLFVFKTKGNYWREYCRFYVVYGSAMTLNFLLLPVCVELFRISPVLAQGGLTFINVIFSYFGHKNFSFRRLNDE